MSGYRGTRLAQLVAIKLLVDLKLCAVAAGWSGLRPVMRKCARPAAPRKARTG